MKYKSKITPAFKEHSFCYMCFPKKNKNAILYEINMTGHEIADKNYRLEREGYYTYLINYTLSGSAKLVYNGNVYSIKKGNLVFINCNEPHLFYPESDSWEFVYTHVSGLGVQFLYDSFCSATGNVYPNYPQKTILQLINKLHELLDSCEKTVFENSFHIHIDNDILLSDISSVVYAILIDINKNVLSLKREIPYSLAKALEFIKNNYNKDITLDEIAKIACMSKFHFERTFKEHTKTTVYQYIKDLRFQNARWLLETTDMSLINVSFAVGYSDIQALNKIFKKNLGVTPTEYRRSVYHY